MVYRKIAVVDSSNMFGKFILQTISHITKIPGYKIELYRNGDEFLEKRKDTKEYGLVTMDLVNTDVNARSNISVIEEMRDLGYHDKIWIVTFQPEGIDSLKENYGIDNVIDKTNMVEEFKEYIPDALDL